MEIETIGLRYIFELNGKQITFCIQDKMFKLDETFTIEELKYLIELEKIYNKIFIQHNIKNE